jgi:CRISPR-associated endoribonuclease Cas6
LIISSPDPNFITQINYQLNKVIENQIPIEMGGLFEIVKIVKIPQKNLNFPIHVITQSPIIIRIPIEKYQNKITNTAPYKSLFWRSCHPVELFVEAIETNLRKKYSEFTGNELKGRVFEAYDFQKQVSTKIDIGRTKIPIIGSLWKLDFSSEAPIELQLFAMDCGLGERNSIGFGFVNPIFQKKH